MEKVKIEFENFLQDVKLELHPFVKFAHSLLIDNDCLYNIELAKSGYLVSYTTKKTGKVVVNFVFRKKGLIIRIYGENVNKYLDIINELPAGMIESINNAPTCKRLLNPLDCNLKCSMGYDFTIKGVRYQKCRYNCFMFDINAENTAYIKKILEKEMAARHEQTA